MTIGTTDDDDLILPFQLDGTGVRGRLVRLGPALDRILSRHAYPVPVTRLLGEAVTIAAALAAALKFDGIFTLQISGDGPIGLIVADVAVGRDPERPTSRALRGYARADRARLAAAADDAAFADLVGRGLLAFTVDQGPDTERYQGLVELTGATLTACVRHYFRQSEQIDTALTAAIGQGPGGAWRAGAILLQRLPDCAPASVPGSADVDDWRRAMLLLETVRADELTAPTLLPTALLGRLFHEDAARVFTPIALAARCRCSAERVGDVLVRLPRDELSSLRIDGAVEVTCDFCNERYRFDAAALDRLFAQSSG